MNYSDMIHAIQRIRNGSLKDLADVLRVLVDSVAAPHVAITDAATYTVLAENSGKVHMLPDLTADITITLPAPQAGMEFEFVYGGAAADAQDWIFNTSATDVLYMGGVVHLDSDANAAGDEVVAVFADFSDDDAFTVLTPAAGTRVRLFSDGTSWLVEGTVVSATAPTFA